MWYSFSFPSYLSWKHSLAQGDLIVFLTKLQGVQTDIRAKCYRYISPTFIYPRGHFYEVFFLGCYYYCFSPSPPSSSLKVVFTWERAWKKARLRATNHFTFRGYEYLALLCICFPSLKCQVFYVGLTGRRSHKSTCTCASYLRCLCTNFPAVWKQDEYTFVFLLLLLLLFPCLCPQLRTLNSGEEKGRKREKEKKGSHFCDNWFRKLNIRLYACAGQRCQTFSGMNKSYTTIIERISLPACLPACLTGPLGYKK